MAKSVIILTVSLLVIFAVLLMLKYSGSADDPKESTQGAYSNLDGDTGEPYVLPESQGEETPEEDKVKPEMPDNHEQPVPEEVVEEKPDPPAPEQPKPVDLPEKIVLPCNDFVATRETSLSEIVDRYYGEYKSGGTRMVDDRLLRKEL
ncbi:MAG: hypothetical protein KAU28_02960, partial [Phycisphaerae bacterium]|nr:hypothetical protein [Phycisphaerae bacterium]